MHVSAIKFDVAHRQIGAPIEEIPTDGLQQTLFHRLLPAQTGPLRWGIGGGYLTAFSENEWTMGYGGWFLFFKPSAVTGVIQLARRWPADLDLSDRYQQALHFVQEESRCGAMKSVFFDRDGQRGYLGSS